MNVFDRQLITGLQKEERRAHTRLCDLVEGFAIGGVMIIEQVHGVFQCLVLFLCFADCGVQIVAPALKLLLLLSCLQDGNTKQI